MSDSDEIEIFDEFEYRFQQIQSAVSLSQNERSDDDPSPMIIDLDEADLSNDIQTYEPPYNNFTRSSGFENEDVIYIDEYQEIAIVPQNRSRNYVDGESNRSDLESDCIILFDDTNTEDVIQKSDKNGQTSELEIDDVIAIDDTYNNFVSDQITDENVRRHSDNEVIQIDDDAVQDDGFEEEYVGFEVVEDFVEEDEVVDLVTAFMIKTVPEIYLKPFYFNWRREVVMRKVDTSHNSSQFDIYYWPPEKGSAKCRSNPDVDKYLEKYPNSAITNANFLFNRKPLGLNNNQFEIVRRASLRDTIKTKKLLRMRRF